jgi:Tfp pilus assembly protein PilZ
MLGNSDMKTIVLLEFPKRINSATAEENIMPRKAKNDSCQIAKSAGTNTQKKGIAMKVRNKISRLLHTKIKVKLIL